MDSCVRIIVTGVVQGVGFRWFVEESALGLGLTGWVKNRLDGSVELEAEGYKNMLNELIKVLHIGPRASTVKGVNVEWKPYEKKYNSFKITM